MTPSGAGPLSRPFPVGRVSPEGVSAEVVATEEERSALARDLDLPAIHSLVGRYRLTGGARRVRVEGRVSARIEQICVVTLDVFPSEVEEEVEVEFEAPADRAPPVPAEPGAEIEADLERPDELVGDRIDLGAITAEFLALGLDPYPRKPGAAFESPEEPGSGASPFAALSDLRKPGPGPGRG